jgi:transposase
MYTLPLFRKILNLNWKKVTIIWFYEESKKIIFKIRWKYNNTTCPHCGFNTNKRQDKKLHKQNRLVPHMPYGWDKMIFLELYKRYFRCTNCNTRFYEKFDFESVAWKYTIHFEQYVQWNWWFNSWNKIAELYQASWSVIYSILERIEPELINKRWMKIIEELDEIYLWVDEHSFSGHDMVLIITELKTWEILAVLDWITKEKLEKWIWSIPLKYHEKIKGFSTDMNKGYANSLTEIIWKPIHTVDKMHLFMEANRVIDDVKDISRHTLAFCFVTPEDAAKLGGKALKDITPNDIKKLNNNQTDPKKIKAMKKYKDKVEQRLQTENINPKDLLNSKWETVPYKEITPEYFTEKWYRTLFVTREKNLSWQQKLRLNQIFRDFDYLGFMQEARTIKEDFMDAIDDLDIKEIDRIMDDCLESEHYRIKQFWRTIKRWYEWIKWYIENSDENFKFTNALTESINNLCKVAKRVSHGFSSKTMYIKKLCARFCLKELQI